MSSVRSCNLPVSYTPPLPPSAPPPPPPPPSCTPGQPPVMGLSRNASTLTRSHLAKLMEPCDLHDVKVQSHFQANLQRIISRSSESQVYISCRREVKPILQDGPCCGIVALAMSGQMLRQDCGNTYDVLKLAKDREFSLQGELFSACNMQLLAQEVYSGHPCCLVKVVNRSKVICHMIQHLSHGCPIIIPYDADGNHEPCLKRGHKAHWALLTGFLSKLKNADECSLAGCTKDEEYPNLYHLQNSTQTFDTLHHISLEEIYVYGVQGKSKHIGVWSLESLLDSNANLTEKDPEWNSGETPSYIIPESLELELCNKIIFLGDSKQSAFSSNNCEF